jgi:hypothetical protein
VCCYCSYPGAQLRTDYQPQTAPTRRRTRTDAQPHKSRPHDQTRPGPDESIESNPPCDLSVLSSKPAPASSLRSRHGTNGRVVGVTETRDAERLPCRADPRRSFSHVGSRCCCALGLSIKYDAQAHDLVVFPPGNRVAKRSGTSERPELRV